MNFTVFGSTGFIGRAVTRYLIPAGHAVDTPERGAKPAEGANLGHVIYAIGLTGNFRTHPEAAIEAHVNVLQRLMTGAKFDSWLYLSSTRVYGAVGNDTVETAALSVRPGLDALYDLSKLLGESFCLAQENPAVRVARLSNVYGAGQSPHTFLGSVLASILETGKVTIGEAPLSAKDYVAVEDVARALEGIALNGKERLYNVAGGTATTHQALAEILRAQGHKVEFATGAVRRTMPAIDIGRLQKEFDFTPRNIIRDLPELLHNMRNA